MSVAPEQLFPELTSWNCLGGNGLASLYTAQVPDGSQTFLVHLLLDPLSGDEALAQAYRERIALASQLQHPSLGRLLGFRESGSSWALVEDLPTGQPLRHRIQAARPSLDDTLALVRALCPPLEAAQALGHGHGCVCPDLVFLDERNTPKLSGLVAAELTARLFHRRPEAAQGHPLAGLERYLPPEITMGKTSESDAIGDVHGLGFLAQEMITGRLPNSWSAKLPLRGEPQAADINSILLCASNQNREERYQAIAQLRDDLENRHFSLRRAAPEARDTPKRASETMEVAEEPTRLALTPKNFKFLFTALGLSVGVGISIFAFQAQESDQPPPPPASFGESLAQAMERIEAASQLFENGNREEALSAIQTLMQTMTAAGSGEGIAQLMGILQSEGEHESGLALLQEAQLSLPPDSQELQAALDGLRGQLTTDQQDLLAAEDALRQGLVATSREHLAAMLARDPESKAAQALLARPEFRQAEEVEATLLQLQQDNPQQTRWSPRYRIQEKGLALDLSEHEELRDLSALSSLPLTSLDLTGTAVSDLSPLQGLPLKELRFADSQVENLGPTVGMPLETLTFEDSPADNVGLLREFQALEIVRFTRNGELYSKLPAPTAARSWENSLGQRFRPLPCKPTVLASIWETRVSDYQAFLTATLTEQGTEIGATWRERTRSTFGSLSPRAPATFINIQEASAFCDWLTLFSRRQGEIDSESRYRLPTDSEWSQLLDLSEPAGIPPTNRPLYHAPLYPGSNRWPLAFVTENFPGQEADASQTARLENHQDLFPGLAPVGKSDPWNGFYDLAANVQELCLPPTNQSSQSVARGSAWRLPPLREGDDLQELLDLSRRETIGVQQRSERLGFRVVLDLDPKRTEPTPLIEIFLSGGIESVARTASELLQNQRASSFQKRAALSARRTIAPLRLRSALAEAIDIELGARRITLVELAASPEEATLYGEAVGAQLARLAMGEELDALLEAVQETAESPAAYWIEIGQAGSSQPTLLIVEAPFAAPLKVALFQESTLQRHFFLLEWPSETQQ